jgi:hypothetical protein
LNIPSGAVADAARDAAAGQTVRDRARLELRPELVLAIAAALAIIVLRSIVPMAFERFDFNSDQAIVGLMARHLSELRTFPLFYYGQNYMLGVESWIAAPFVLIGGTTIAMMRLPLVIIGAAAAVLCLLAFVRQGMRPMLALVATLPIVATTPIVSATLLELGASVEPFLYVMLLWWLRRRPYVFGALLCVAILHREFTMFAATSIAVVQWRDGSWSTKSAAKAGASFACVWVLIDVLKRTVNMYGPAGGVHESASLTLQARQIAMWLSIEVRPYLARLVSVLTNGLPDVFGGRSHLIRTYGPISTIAAGSTVAGWALAAASLICGWRLARRAITPGAGFARDDRTSFPLYLALIGVQTLLVYGLNSGIVAQAPTIIRFVLFALLLPVAALGAFFHHETSPRYRGAVVALVGVWAALTVADNVRLLREYLVSPPQNNYRELTDYLVEHRIKYARAIYWDCYVVSFLSGERVIVASTDKVRVGAYQARVEANAANAVRLRRLPCTSGKVVASWCLEDPLGR